ncbi:MAG: hemerythrin domain-containing protein [Alphaproteobacteria bacterium]|nr:hemerythrin domain-containing protein [Alphaproteobacteria bacterium]
MALIRRQLLSGAATCGVLVTASCDEDEKDVGAVEDLMREHGVIRRAILVYRDAATKLRAGAPVDIDALHRAATLLRDFGEDYHERELEEAHIFPRLKQAGGPAAALVDVLIAQHNKGREITRQVLAAKASDGAQLADLLDAFELMYEHHAAREDTIIFPAWKKALSEKELADMGEKFEDIEKKRFGGDGFDKAVAEIDAIEHAAGVDRLDRFTPR